MITNYATLSQLMTWPTITEEPPNAAGLIRSATLIVAQACNRNPYTDQPTAADAQALADATCAQVATWAALGVNPAALGLDTAPVKKTTLLGADVEQDTTGQAAALQAAASGLAPLAREILLAAGLLWQALPVGAPDFDRLPSWGQGRDRSWLSPFADPLSGEVGYPYAGPWWS